MRTLLTSSLVAVLTASLTLMGSVAGATEVTVTQSVNAATVVQETEKTLYSLSASEDQNCTRAEAPAEEPTAGDKPSPPVDRPDTSEDRPDDPEEPNTPDKPEEESSNTTHDKPGKKGDKGDTGTSDDGDDTGSSDKQKHKEDDGLW